MTSESLIRAKRDEYHAGLIEGGTLTVSASGVASMADGGNRLSVALSADVARALQVSTAQERAAGQTLGGTFETATAAYIEATFPAFGMLRPGRWQIRKIGNRAAVIPTFEPYQHLAKLEEAIRKSPDLAAVLGNGYAISPDIVVTRAPEPDEVINMRRCVGRSGDRGTYSDQSRKPVAADPARRGVMQMDSPQR